MSLDTPDAPDGRLSTLDVFRTLILTFLSLVLATDAVGSETPGTITQALASAPDGLWESREISVCWLDPAPNSSYHRLARMAVQEAVEETWSSVAEIVFTGWRDCTGPKENPGADVPVRICDDPLPDMPAPEESRYCAPLDHDRGPAVVGGTGRQLDYVRLKFGFSGVYDEVFACGSRPEFCARAQGVHEFGHVLGFIHENDRENTPAECRDRIDSSDRDSIYYSGWDPYSVMNYCNGRYGMYGLNGDEYLSPGDRFGAVRAYGANHRQILDANEVGDLFGSAFAVGDFDGDGLDDLAVGAPGESIQRAGFERTMSGTGAVYVFLGSARGGLQAYRVLTAAQSTGAEEIDNMAFGSALAAGDFDGDGRAEIAVGAPNAPAPNGQRSGAVMVYEINDLVEGAGVYFQGALGTDEAGDEFGYSLASGDINGDGKDDLVVGAPGEQPGSDQRSGYAFVYLGHESSMLTHWDGLDQSQSTSNASGDRFGTAVLVADFDNDGRGDVAIGAPGKRPATVAQASGSVATFRSEDSGLATWKTLSPPSFSPSAEQQGDLFGASLAAGDIDGDGLADLVIGAPDGDGQPPARSGSVFVAKGSRTGPRPWKVLGQAPLGMDEPEDRFGAALAVGDLNSDGFEDIFVGAPGEAVSDSPERGGYVFAYRGLASGPDAWAGLDQTPIGSQELNDELGFSLAIGKFERLGKAKNLVVGAPFESPFQDPQSGYVYVYGVVDSNFAFQVPEVVAGEAVRKVPDHLNPPSGMGITLENLSIEKIFLYHGISQEGY